MTLGILGGGQLARMTAQAAIRLGIDVRILTPSPAGPTAPFAGTTVADWTDPFVLRDWADGCDAVTVESEWAPADRLLDVLPDGCALRPHPSTLHTIRHKGRQKAAFDADGLAVPRWSACDTLEAAHLAAIEYGWPVLAKRYEGSYDGYGNATCRTPEELTAAWDALSADDGVLIEAWVPFEREVSALVARRPGGESAVYPVIGSEHRDHQLVTAYAPAGLEPTVEAEARRLALAAIEAVDGVGLLAVEMFVLPDGRVLLNEIAPRPHNTGHLTIEACHTSQFENHARAALDLPLGDPALRVPAACMVNVVGQAKSDGGVALVPESLDVPGATVHLYGKASTRPRRKMGHVTATAPDVESARKAAAAAVDALYRHG